MPSYIPPTVTLNDCNSLKYGVFMFCVLVHPIRSDCFPQVLIDKSERCVLWEVGIKPLVFSYLVERGFVRLIRPENPEYLVVLLNVAVHIFQSTAKYSQG